MYLHIGDNNIIKSKNIIGIFDIKSLKQSKENDYIFDKININNKTKTLIVGKEENYFSKISAETINKRIKNIYTKGESKNGK